MGTLFKVVTKTSSSSRKRIWDMDCKYIKADTVLPYSSALCKALTWCKCTKENIWLNMGKNKSFTTFICFAKPTHHRSKCFQ